MNYIQVREIEGMVSGLVKTLKRHLPGEEFQKVRNKIMVGFTFGVLPKCQKYYLEENGDKYIKDGRILLNGEKSTEENPHKVTEEE